MHCPLNHGWLKKWPKKEPSSLKHGRKRCGWASGAFGAGVPWPNAQALAAMCRGRSAGLKKCLGRGKHQPPQGGGGEGVDRKVPFSKESSNLGGLLGKAPGSGFFF